MKIRKFIKSIVPEPIWNRLGTLRKKWVTRDDHRLTTREVFSRIYEKRIWIGEESYSSGNGSRNQKVVDPYIEAISQWAKSNHAENMTALDIGCGDFHVGRRIFPIFKRYIAADIVPILIQNHQKEHIADNLEFRCIDAINDDLPQTDVIFIRQVLQHLSNGQISKIVSKLSQFQHAIITEHVPLSSLVSIKNIDKIHGGGIRLEQGSGIYLEESPFFLTSVESRELLKVPAGQDESRDGMIITTYYRLR